MKTKHTLLKSIATGFAASLLCLGFTAPVSAASVNLDQLLNEIRQGRASDASANQQRMRDFQANRARQAALLQKANSDVAAAERVGDSNNRTFEANDNEISVLNDQLDVRLGDLKELFGVLQQATGDARVSFNDSLTALQFPARKAFMADISTKMGETSKFASIAELEQLVDEMQRELRESGKVAKFMAPVESNGVTTDKMVTRVGNFNAVSGGKYLKTSDDGSNFIELPRQPQSRFTSKISGLESATSGLAPLAVDVTRGQILGTYIKRPTLTEKIHEGGPVGYTIIGLGIIGVLLAIWRLLVLGTTSAAVNRQAKNLGKPGKNPLGRVLKVYNDSGDANTETLELRLGEAILKETPKLNRLLGFLKIIAVVAPLLGLLGTVTGMIQTFQAIQLYGAGDPQLMAGGISQALVTTVLGLCVAIPMVFLHSLVAGRAKSVTEVITQQAAGMVAERSEKSS